MKDRRMDAGNGLLLRGCSTPRRPRAHRALRELGCAYRCEPVQPRVNDARKVALARLTPRGNVPVLQDGDFTPTESAAIVTRLFATHAGGTVPEAASEPRARAQYDEWCFSLMTELDATSLYVLRRHVGLAHIYGEASAAVAGRLRRLAGPACREAPPDRPAGRCGGWPYPPSAAARRARQPARMTALAGIETWATCAEPAAKDAPAAFTRSAFVMRPPKAIVFAAEPATRGTAGP